MARFQENSKEWNNCNDCPYNKYVSDEEWQSYSLCTKTNENIEICTPLANFKYERKDFRNTDGVLDNCPFLKRLTNTEILNSLTSGRSNWREKVKQNKEK